jgi:hypothetical protein
MREEHRRATTLVGGASDGRQAIARSVALAVRGRYEFPSDGGDLPVGLGDAICRMKKAEKLLTCRQSIIERAAGVF